MGFSGGPEEDAGYSISQLKTILDTYGLPDRPYQVNEYGPWALQVGTGLTFDLAKDYLTSISRILAIQPGSLPPSKGTTSQASEQTGVPTSDPAKISTMEWHSWLTGTPPPTNTTH